MNEDGGKRVRARRADDSLGEVDWISSLPDSLIFQILLNLPTKDVVKSSVLSSKWRNLWRYVLGLDLKFSDFLEYKPFVRFIDRFLEFNSESCLQHFKLKFEFIGTAFLTRWLDIVPKRKVQHLLLDEEDEMEMPPRVYTCESLVSLELYDVILPNPTFICLPRVKAIHLFLVKFPNDLAFEMFISGCPLLESLSMHRISCYSVKVLRVCSKSLLSFTHTGLYDHDILADLVLVMEAPKLEFLKLDDHEIATFIMNNSGSLVKVDIDIVLNMSSKKRFDATDLPKRIVISNFLLRISNVKDMIISSYTLEVIYSYSRWEQLPLYRNLSFLRVDYYDHRWEMLPIFLESCPNLKSLSLIFVNFPRKPIIIVPGPRCFLPSLEFVEIVRPMLEEAIEMKLVSYFLENSTILKKLTLCLDDSKKNEASVTLKKLLTISRLSTSCQVVIC